VEPLRAPADPASVVVLRPLATPLPLTFAALLLASLVSAGYELGWVPHDERTAVGLVLIAVPLPTQLLGAVAGFAARSAAAATGGGVLAAVWLAIALDLINGTSHRSGPSAAVGMLALGAAAALIVPAFAELATGAHLALTVLTAASLRFLLTGLSGLTHDPSWTHASGWTGIAVAAIAFYAALALELEAALGHSVLPTFRTGAAKRALDGHVGQLKNEAGVRRAL
jgi:succinate-acetate transporter protein